MSETIVTDGRASRASRTRSAVVDALLALINDGNLRPTAREVADAAGVSLRSVYVHFDDVESLFLAASARHYERVQELSTGWDPGAPLAERVRELVARRGRIYEDGAQVRRAALLQEPFSPALRQALEYGRRAGRSELDAVFAPELAAVDEAQRPRLRAALEVVTGAATWDQLRSHPDVGEDAGATATLVGELVHAALRAWGQGYDNDEAGGPVGPPPPTPTAEPG